MCMIECLETANVNKKLVRITNPGVGLYFAIVVEILKQVKAKNKFDPETGMFKLNRKYVESETGIGTSEQKNCDQILNRLGIVNIDPQNTDRISVDMKKYFEVLSDNSKLDVEVLPPTVKLTRAEKQAAKENGIKARIVGLWPGAEESGNPEIESISKLVNVYYGKGLVKCDQWEQIFKLLRAAAVDSDAVVELVNYVIATNYTSIPAAIDSFMRSHKPTATRLGTKQEKSGKLMSGVEF